MLFRLNEKYFSFIDAAAQPKTPGSMKIITCLCLSILLTSTAHSQESELNDFGKALNLYVDLLTGKAGSLPLNKANEIKLRKDANEAFKKFVLNKNSNQYDKLTVIRDDEKSRFLRLDGRVSLYTKTFTIDNKTYIVYSFTSRDLKNYCIKDNESNTIVYEANSGVYLIDDLYQIEPGYFLLIEKTGDMNSGRSAYVLTAEKIPWRKFKAFEGKAFGQVPGEYFTKKFVKKREQFQLECEMDFTLSAPKDINTILFDPSAKVISYKQYEGDRKFKIITAKWENKTFIIDDYNVQENLPADGMAVPQ